MLVAVRGPRRKVTNTAGTVSMWKGLLLKGEGRGKERKGEKASRGAHSLEKGEGLFPS